MMKTAYSNRILSVLAATIGLTLHVAAQGAPAVSNVSGAVNHGNSITVSGSGFGSHSAYNNISGDWKGSKYLNFRFKDFEDGQMNSNGFYPQKGGGLWSVAASELGVLSGGPKNSTKYLKRAYVTDEPGGVSADVSGAGNQLYTTFKFYMAANTQSGKFFRFYGDAPQNNVYLSSGCTNYMVRGYSECTSGSCSGVATEWGSGPQLTPGQWHRVEVWADGSKSNFSVAVDGVAAWQKSNWLNSSLLMNGHTLDYPNMLDASSRDAACPAVGSYGFDDIFVDFTQARVEIGDAPTWSASRKKEVQIPSSWTDSAVTVRVNSGEFTAGQSVYLYVVDSSGAVNSQGLPIKIGGSSVSPKAPASVIAN